MTATQRVEDIRLVINDEGTTTLEVRDTNGLEMTPEFLAQVNAGETTAVNAAISAAVAAQHDSDLETFATPSDVSTAVSEAVATQHTTDLGIFSTPASVATAISAQHETDNATYAPLASPALTGTPTAPTAVAGTSTTQVATTAFAAAATLAARYPGRLRVGFLGDSITQGGDTYRSDLSQTIAISDSPAGHAMFASQGRWDLVINAGITGQRSDEILARIPTDIIANGCDVCVIYSTVMNDVLQSVAYATTMGYVEQEITTLLAAGVLPILCSPTPGAGSFTAAQTTSLLALRRGMQGLVERYRIPSVDLWPLLGDPLTGALKTAYQQNGTNVHPTTLGREAGGRAVASVLNSLFPGGSFRRAVSAVNTNDLLGGYGWFGVDTNADGVADGWSGTASGTGFAWTRVSDATYGYLQRVTTTAAASGGYNTRNITVVAGNTIEISGWIGKTGTSYGQLVLVAGAYTVTVPRPAAATDGDAASGRISFRYVVPAGVTTITMRLAYGAGTGTVDFAGLAVRDLTAAGLT